MKPRFVIAMLLVLALAVPVQMLAQQNSKAEKEVRAVLDTLIQANVKGGTEAATIVDKYIADDFIRIPPNGAVYTKAEIIDGFKSGKIKVEAASLADVKIHIYGRTAVATGILRSEAAMMGAADTGQSRWTRVLVKQNGIWKSVLFQNTRITEPAKQ
jgi:hypothetical protein